MKRSTLFAAACALLLARPAARADVTLVRDAGANTWTLENDFLRVSVNAAGRVPTLIKKTGVAAGTNQAVPSYAAFLERVNEKTPSVQSLTPDPDGDDSPARRSLRVRETLDSGAGVVFDVTKTYRLRDGEHALEAELSFRNTSAMDWTAVDPHKGAESLVYVAPGGSAPAGDTVQLMALDGPDVAFSDRTTWWGAGAVPRPAPAQGFLAAVDGVNTTINALVWDVTEQTANSRDGRPAVSVYPGVNRFQLEAWRTRLPAGETVTWTQRLLVDDGIPFVSFSAYGSVMGGVVTDRPAYAAGEAVSAVFRLNSTRSGDAVYSLRGPRIIGALDSTMAEAADVEDIPLPAWGRAAPSVAFALPVGTAAGAYTVTADIYEGETRLGAIVSLPVNVAAPVPPQRGDVNADGAVDAADVALCLQVAGGIGPSDPDAARRADVDGDGAATLPDALALAGRLGANDAAETVLTILHTNDMHGHVLGNSNLDSSGPGGLARLNTLARPIRYDMPNVLLLDAGDNVQATPTEFYSGGTTMFSAMNAVGFDASTLGNHEFDWAQAQTARLIRQAHFPVLAANVRDTRTGQAYGGAREYVLFRRGPLRIAVFGLTTPDTVRIEWPPTLSHVRFEDPNTVAARLVPELRRQADVVIAVTHLGVSADRALAAAVPGIDVIIGGHTHTTLSEHLWVGGTLIAQAGDYANYLGRIDLLLRRSAGGWTIASVNGKGGRWWADQPDPPLGKTYPRAVLLPVTADIVQDPAVADGYLGPFNQVRFLLNEPIASVPASIAGSGSASTPRPLPATMANLLRLPLNADVGLMPALSRDLPAGTATVRSVYVMYGGYTRQNVVLVRATGAAIRAAVLAAYGTAGSYPVYFGGLGGRVTRAGSTVTWQSPTVNGAPLDDARYYLVASGSYPLMDYPTLRDSPMVSDQAGWVKPLLADAMRRENVITPYAGLALP